jgi:hypothetical protein
VLQQQFCQSGLPLYTLVQQRQPFFQLIRPICCNKRCNKALGRDALLWLRAWRPWLDQEKPCCRSLLQR